MDAREALREKDRCDMSLLQRGIPTHRALVRTWAIAEYRCPNCDTPLEKFDGEHLVAYRIAVRPVRLAAIKT
jgi:hypothetical protein